MKKISFHLFALLLVSTLIFSCAEEAQTVKDAATQAADKAEQAAKAVAKKVTTATTGLKIGDTAPDFKLKNVDGTMIGFDNFQNAKGYIVTFTCNHCPYAVMYEDRLIALNKEYASKGYPVIAINPNDPEVNEDDSFEKMIVRAKEKGFTFPYLFDDGQKIYPQYGATKTPHVFLLDKDKKVRYIGAIDDNYEDAAAVEVKYVENAIASLEVGKDPEPATTKAIGCSIKKKS